jgi:putative hemolysin
MNIILLEILVIVLLLVINGIFAMSELAVIAAKKIRLEHRAERGDAGARAALALARDPTQFLSTVQVGITLVGVLAGAFGGATLAEKLAEELTAIAWLAPYADRAAFAIVVAFITYLSLIIGELVPKRIALGNPERVASLIARPMGMIARIGQPVVRLLTGSTRMVLKLFGMKDVPEPGLTEEEIHALVEQGAESGAVPEVEHEIVESVFRLGDRRVASMMTARRDLEWLELRTSDEALRARLTEQRRPWFLVCEDDVENVRGVVHASDLLTACVAGDQLDLGNVLSEPLYVPNSMLVLQLLERFRMSRQHVAVVLDEFGGVDGLVTIDDILGELVGEMPTAGAVAKPLLRRDEHGWLAAGALPIEDLAAELDDVAGFEADSRRGYRTVAGFIMTHAGHVPAVGETLRWQGYDFEVAEMDGRRIELIRIRRVN